MFSQTFYCTYLFDEKDKPIDKYEFFKGLSGAIVTVGGTVGALGGGRFLDYGKKFCINVASVITIIGCIMMSASPPYGLIEFHS